MQSIRSAPRREPLGARQRVRRQVLAEQHDVGLERLAAVAARDAAGVGRLPGRTSASG